MKKKNLYFAIVDFEKAFHRVPSGFVRWTIRKLNVDKWIIKTIIAMYEFSNSAAKVNIVCNKFNVKVGINQEFVLNPLLFIMVLEEIKRVWKWSTMRNGLYK